MEWFMSKLFFEWDYLAFILLGILSLALFPLWRWSKQFKQPTFFYSSLNGLMKNNKTWRHYVYSWSNYLSWIALGWFSLAFVDPHFFIAKDLVNTVNEGIAIYLVVDHSGSMDRPIKTVSDKGLPVNITKMELMKQLTEQFVTGGQGLTGRTNDLIGLVEFARTAQVLVPLTLNHKMILDRLKSIESVKNVEDNGSAIGYAISKTTNLITATRYYEEDLPQNELPPYTIKSAIIILITDGFHSLNPLDENNPYRSINPIVAAEYAKKNGVKVYLINIDPALAVEEFSPHRNQMQSIATITGGKYYLMTGDTSLKQIYADIDQLEKSRFSKEQFLDLPKDQQPHRYKRISLYPYLIAVGMLFLFLGIISETILLRKIP